MQRFLGSVDILPGVLGQDYTCVIQLNKLSCWGDTTPSNDLNMDQVTQVSLGYQSGCALDNEGVKCWNHPGEPYDGDDIEELHSGENHSCVIKTDRTLECWQEDTAETTPPDDLGPVKKLALGISNSCAINADDMVRCWGDGGAVDAVPDDLGPAKEIAIGDSQACAIKMDGTVDCWGSGGGADHPETITGATVIAAGDAHTCTIDTSGVTCWGREGASVNMPDLVKPSQISLGSNHTCAVDTQGLKCWGGNNGAGELNLPEDYIRDIFLLEEMLAAAE